MTHQENIYDLVRLIPKGKVTTYGRISDFLALGSARVVGWALNQCNKNGANIPAHRVVNRKGELSGRRSFSTPTTMQELLEKEGVKILDNCVVNFDSVVWNPMEVLK